MIEAAAQSFHAARQRYRQRRLSRSNSRSEGDNISTCSASDIRPPRRITSKHSGRELNLDDDQCEQLSADFSNIPDKYYAFEQMFLRLFVHIDPQIALVFGFTGIPELELRRKTPFRTHVCKFQRFMTTVMDLLPKRGREDELIQIIRMVGRQHCNVKLLSFTANRWLSFKSALLLTFAKNEQDKFHKYWSILIGFLIGEIKDAYLAHIRHLRSNSLPHVSENYRLEFRRQKPGSEDTNGVCAAAPAAAVWQRKTSSSKAKKPPPSPI